MIVIPCFPLMSNCVIVLCAITPDMKWFTVSNLSSDLLSKELAEESQPVFAFTYENNQLTWPSHSPEVLLVFLKHSHKVSL